MEFVEWGESIFGTWPHRSWVSLEILSFRGRTEKTWSLLPEVGMEQPRRGEFCGGTAHKEEDLCGSRRLLGSKNVMDQGIRVEPTKGGGWPLPFSAL